MDGNGIRRALGLAGRHRLAVAASVVVIAAVAAVLAVVLPSGYGEQVSGPFGTVAATVPGADGPPRVVGQFYGPVLVDGGMAIVEGGNKVLAAHGGQTTTATDGITAVNLSTRKLYWSYERAGRSVARLAQGPGALYVLWNDGLLTRLDPKTARVSWHYQAAGADVSSAQTRVVASGATVLVVSEAKIYGVNAATGAERWTAVPGGTCSFVAGWPAVTPSVLAVYVQSAGGGCPGRLQAYSLTSGRPQWQHPDQYAGAGVALAADDDTIVGEGTNVPLAAYRADNGQQEAVMRYIPRGGEYSSFAAQDSRVLEEDFSEGTFGVADASTGRLMWSQRVPAGGNFVVSPEFAGPDRVDMVFSTSDGPKIPDGLGDGKTLTAARLWLYEYDTKTGHLASRTELPLVLPAGQQTAGDAAKFRYTANPEITGTGPGVIAVSEAAPDFGQAILGVDSELPTLVVSG